MALRPLLDGEVRRFFGYCIEREAIRLRRAAGDAPPWTDDEVLQREFFTNVFREDDRTTRWFRRNFRGPAAENSRLVALGTITFRWFNFIPSGERLLGEGLLMRWDTDRARKALAGLGKKTTGAYMIKTPPGLDKIAGLGRCLDAVWADADGLVRDLEAATTLQAMHERLLVYPYLGPFMAYEVVTDLRHTCLGRGATDILTWASAGPGAARGASRMLAEGDPRAIASYSSPGGQAECLRVMRALLARAPELWPYPSRPWEMREVEHNLCEFDKYERVRRGESARTRRGYPTKESEGQGYFTSRTSWAQVPGGEVAE